MSDWWLDHPVIVIALIAGSAIAGALTRVLTAWLLVGQHLLSPDNVPAGSALGFGGSMAGLAVGLLAVWRQNARHAHRA